MAALVTSAPRLVVTDAGNDSAENITLFRSHSDTEFVVKRNPRDEARQPWLELAKEQTGEGNHETIDRGARAWYGETNLQLPGQQDLDKQDRITQRVVFRVIERFDDMHGQYLLGDQLFIDAYWTSLGWTPQQVHAFYEKRGTSEQYHSELKSDMALAKASD